MHLPEVQVKSRDVRLGAQLGIGLFPIAQWSAENPGKGPGECPEEFLEVRIAVLASEVRPSALNPNEAEWPRASMPIEITTIPWRAWRRMMDAQFMPVAEADA